MFVAALPDTDLCGRAAHLTDDLERHRPDRVALWWKPVGVGHKELSTVTKLHDSAIENATQRPKDVILKRRRLPLDRVDPERSWRRDRPDRTPPCCQRVRVKERRDDLCRRGGDIRFFSNWSFGRRDIGERPIVSETQRRPRRGRSAPTDLGLARKTDQTVFLAKTEVARAVGAGLSRHIPRVEVTRYRVLNRASIVRGSRQTLRRQRTRFGRSHARPGPRRAVVRAGPCRREYRSDA